MAEVDKLRQDPNMPGTQKQKTLRFKEQAEPKPDKKKSNTDLGWLRGFAEWISQAGRVLVWVAAGVLIALVLVKLRYWVRARADGRLARPVVPPSHVRDLDIRPESLPDHIGAAAAALWQRGEHRAALSLLYRGALSRLVHDHAVPVRAASTEGECMVLAARQLSLERSAFFGRLVRAWQMAVYGAHLPESAQVLSLCADFDTQLRAAAPPMEPAR
jgi:hypothetical protein